MIRSYQPNGHFRIKSSRKLAGHMEDPWWISLPHKGITRSQFVFLVPDPMAWKGDAFQQREDTESVCFPSIPTDQPDATVIHLDDVPCCCTDNCSRPPVLAGGGASTPPHVLESPGPASCTEILSGSE